MTYEGVDEYEIDQALDDAFDQIFGQAMDEDSETLYRAIELFDAAEEEFWDQFHASDGAEVTLETPEELSRLLGNQSSKSGYVARSSVTNSEWL